VEQVENRVSGMEDKVEELDQIVKDHANGTCRISGTP
jgi:hypothetical protein